VLGQHRAQLRGAAASARAIEQLLDRREIEQLLDRDLVARALQAAAGQDRRQLQQCQRDRRARDAVDRLAILRLDAAADVRSDAVDPPAVRRHGHLDVAQRRAADARQGRARAMAQQRVRPARQHRRHPVPPLAQHPVAGGVDAGVHVVQLPRVAHARHLIAAETQPQQLAPRDDAVLGARKLRHDEVAQSRRRKGAPTATSISMARSWRPSRHSGRALCDETPKRQRGNSGDACHDRAAASGPRTRRGPEGALFLPYPIA
jgi:hypothetical protein